MSKKSLTNKPAAVSPEEPEVDPRDWPGLRDLMRPTYLFQWMWEFTECWFMSRAYGRLLLGLPFLIVAVGGGSYVWWLRRAPQAEMISAYEDGVQAAMEDGRHEDALLYMQSLVQQRPLQERYRYNLALFLLKAGQTDAAMHQINELTPLDKAGFIPARVWLAVQANAPDAVVEVSAEQAMAQLRKAIEEQPDSVDAHQLLAETYLRQNQLRQAEQHLLKVVNAKPEVALLLAKVQRQIGRSEDLVATHLKSAQERFEQRLVQNPLDDGARIGWSEALSLSGNAAEAQAVLVEGMRQQASPALQQALATLYSGLAAKRMKDSSLNRDSAAALLIEAIKLQPDNKIAVAQLLQLAGAGATVTADQLQPALTFWKKKIGETGEDADLGERLLLVQLLASSKEEDAAIEQMEALAEQQPEMRMVLGKLYRAAGRTQQADALLTSLLAEQTEEFQRNSTARSAAVHAETLLIAGRNEDARTFLKSRISATKPDDADAALLKALAGRAALAVYDERFAAQQSSGTDSANTTAADDTLVELLMEALQTPTVGSMVLERLTRLSCSSHPLADEAEVVINKMLAGGNDNAQIYTFIGTNALASDQISRARKQLERAYSINKRDPMVLNNLALALVRESPDNATRAMELLNEALTFVPGHPDMLSSRAEVLMAQQKWEEARRDLELALMKKPQNRNIHELLATVCEELGDSGVAEQHRQIVENLQDET